MILLEKIEKIKDFLQSERKGLLITGTHQCKKHWLIMSLLNHYYKDCAVLYRISYLNNITMKDFTPLNKTPKAGQGVRMGNNWNYFDAMHSINSWDKTANKKYDFAIVYPLDGLTRKKGVDVIEELLRCRSIGKVFLCSCVLVTIMILASFQNTTQTI